MYVAEIWLVINCECLCCTHRFVAVAPGIAMKLIGKDEHIRMPLLRCKYCKSDQIVYNDIKEQ